ncbi:MAG TPA: oligosaccharide flippase family protein [Bryobacteraceae bacterium]|nr:oligosaccharide flippase family protein [Bryobacteraceae bacterium]
MSTPKEALSSRSLFKHMLQASGLYSLAFVGQQLVSFALIPIKTRYLPPADYGVLGLLEKTAIILSTLLGASLPGAIGYFYFKTGSREMRRRVVMTAVAGSGGLGLLACVLCWPFAPALSRLLLRNETITYSLLLVFLSMPLAFTLEALFGWLRVEDRQKMWLVGALTRLAVTVVAVVLFLAAFRLRIIGVQYAALASMGIPLIILGAYCLYKNRPEFDLGLFLQMLRFAIPLGLGGLAMFLIHFGDQFFLVRYVTLTELGLYSFAYTLGMLVSGVYGSFAVYWGAQVYQIMQREDAEPVFARVFTYVALGIVFCGLGIVVCSKPALGLLTTRSYAGALPLIPVLVMAYCVRSFGEFFRSLFMVAGRPGHDAACTWVASAVCLAGYALLIPRFGVWGAVGATVATFFVFTAVTVVWTYRLRHYRVEPGRLLRIAAALAVIGILYARFPVSSLVWQIGWAALLIVLFPLLLCAMQFPTPGELEAVRSVCRRIVRVPKIRTL